MRRNLRVPWWPISGSFQLILSLEKALPPSVDFRLLGSAVESLSTSQHASQDKASELLVLLHKDVLSRLMGLPDGMAASIKVAQLAQAELLEHAVMIEDFTEV